MFRGARIGSGLSRADCHVLVVRFSVSSLSNSPSRGTVDIDVVRRDLPVFHFFRTDQGSGKQVQHASLDALRSVTKLALVKPVANFQVASPALNVVAFLKSVI